MDERFQRHLFSPGGGDGLAVIRKVTTPEWIHTHYVAGRRVRVLAQQLAKLIPEKSRVLDVGCGDGLLAEEICRLRPDVTLKGIDVLGREGRHFPVELFDGSTIPYPDDAFDVAMLVDVLHHAPNAEGLLAECVRVASDNLLIKDHTREGLFAGPILRFMDRLGNQRHGVALPYKYWTRDEWRRTFDSCQLEVRTWIGSLNLYPVPAHWVFDRSLHFMALLDVRHMAMQPKDPT